MHLRDRIAESYRVLLDVHPAMASYVAKDLLAWRRWDFTDVMGALLAVMVWGAGHALTPGHGKTIVAAYLIGSRSMPWQALYLGLTVTLTHTLRVFALGLVALFASPYVLPKQLYPWLGAVSGLIVVSLGGMLLWRRVQPLLGRREHDYHR
jgi:nickel/cobalt exporter